MTIVRTNVFRTIIPSVGVIPLPENNIGVLRVRFISVMEQHYYPQYYEVKQETDPYRRANPPPRPVNGMSKFQNKKHDEQNRSQSKST